MIVKRFNAQDRAASTSVTYCFHSMLRKTAVLQSVALFGEYFPELSASEVKVYLSRFISQSLDELLEGLI